MLLKVFHFVGIPLLVIWSKVSGSGNFSLTIYASFPSSMMGPYQPTPTKAIPLPIPHNASLVSRSYFMFHQVIDLRTRVPFRSHPLGSRMSPAFSLLNSWAAVAFTRVSLRDYACQSPLCTRCVAEWFPCSPYMFFVNFVGEWPFALLSPRRYPLLDAFGFPSTVPLRVGALRQLRVP